MWELAREAIEFEAMPSYEQHKTAEKIRKLNRVEQSFFEACLDYKGVVDYKELNEDFRSRYEHFERNEVQIVVQSLQRAGAPDWQQTYKRCRDNHNGFERLQDIMER